MKTNTQVKRNKRSYIIIALIVVLLLSAVGYAAFQANLLITGTATGSATWDVHFTSASTGTLSNNNQTLTFTETLGYPGDAKEVTAVIENSSSMGIKLTGFTVTDGNDVAVSSVTFGSEQTTDDPILIQYISLDTTDASQEKIAKNGVCTYKFVVFWNKNYSDTTNLNPTKTFKITLNYEQDTTSPSVAPSHGAHT